MAKKMDAEGVLDEIKTALVATLNAKIDAVTADWAADDATASRSVTLHHIDASAYFLQTLNDAVANFDPFVIYGIDDPRAVGLGPATLKNYKITVAICASDTGQDKEVARRMFRYSRALEETFEAYFARITSGFKVTVESLAPIQFKLMDTGNDYRAVGVSLSVGIA